MGFRSPCRVSEFVVWPLGVDRSANSTLRLMIEVLHYLSGPKLWESWYIPYYG